MASIAARLLELAERHPSAAPELRALAEEVAGQRRRAGRASAAAQADMLRQAQEPALRLAQARRRDAPRSSASRLAEVVGAGLGPSAPGVRTLRRWIAAWERSGRLSPP